MTSNILLIIIDSLREDKFQGKTKSSLTPNIEKLVKKGTYFTQAISSADVTGICLGNIFTGMFSQKTGIIQRRFNPKIKTIFDILKENNFHVYGTVPDLMWFKQITEKFDEVEKYFAANRVQNGLSDDVGKFILKRLQSKKMKEPWIYYIHLEDLHEKIQVPPEYDKNEFGETKYDRMVSYIDTWIGKILNHCNLEETLIIITSDHGEYIPVIDNIGQIPRVQTIMKKGKEIVPALEPIGLKLFILIRNLTKKNQQKKLKKQLSPEQLRTLNARGQITLYDETLKVPLLFVGKGISNKTLNDLVGGIDILPTILNQVGIKIDNSNLDGRDLNILINGEKLQEIPMFIQTGDTQEQKESKVVGVRTSKFKYYRNRKNPKENVCLYDLQKDPLEKNNIYHLFPEIVKSMETILEKYEKIIPITEINLDEKSEKEIGEELKKMGYL